MDGWRLGLGQGLSIIGARSHIHDGASATALHQFGTPVMVNDILIAITGDRLAWDDERRVHPVGKAREHNLPA